MDEQSVLMLIRCLPNGCTKFKNKEEAIACVDKFISLVKESSGFDIDVLLSNQKMQLKDIKNKCDDIGYVNSFQSKVYDDMKNMMKDGFSNKAIASKLNIHINTVSKWRIRWKQNKEI